MINNDQTRRNFIKYGTAIGIAGLAGCSGLGGGGNGSGNGSGNGDGNSDNDGYPSDNITIIVPWSQGGGTDRSTRATATPWSEQLDTEIIVENYPGAGSQIGGERLYQADPDGYTVGMWNLPQMQATWIFQDAPYDDEDFNYLGTHHLDPTMWFAPQDSPYGNMTEFIEYSEENDVTVGLTSAIGNTALSALLVQDTYDLDLNLVNLEGGTPVRQAILAGDVDAAVNQPWAFNPQHAGDVTVLGSHTTEQIPEELWPDVPSFADLGLDDVPLVEDDGLGQWKLMVTPGGLREEYPDRFDLLQQSYAETIQSDDFLSRAEEQTRLDLIVDYRDPDETQEIVQRNTEFMEEYQGLFESI